MVAQFSTGILAHFSISIYRYYGNDLLKHALHNTVPDITKTVQDKDGKDIKVRDADAIQLADAKINEIRKEFVNWLNEQLPQFKQKTAYEMS